MATKAATKLQRGECHDENLFFYCRTLSSFWEGGNGAEWQDCSMQRTSHAFSRWPKTFLAIVLL